MRCSGAFTAAYGMLPINVTLYGELRRSDQPIRGLSDFVGHENVIPKVGDRLPNRFGDNRDLRGRPKRLNSLSGRLSSVVENKHELLATNFCPAKRSCAATANIDSLGFQKLRKLYDRTVPNNCRDVNICRNPSIGC